jgi:hypothetical protein
MTKTGETEKNLGFVLFLSCVQSLCDVELGIDNSPGDLNAKFNFLNSLKKKNSYFNFALPVVQRNVTITLHLYVFMLVKNINY